jgi:hypothetical protein
VSFSFSFGWGLVSDSKAEDLLPITIEVETAHTAAVEHFLWSASDALKVCCEELLPNQVISVIPNDQVRLETAVREEHSLPSVTGTLGGIICCGENLYGITAGHVCKAAEDPLVDQSPEALVSVVNECVDVAFIKLQAGAASTSTNVLPLSMVPHIDLKLELGEPVYKYGKATGFQVGTLASDAASFYCSISEKRYLDHVKVRWNTDGSRFAHQGDSGALYCVKRGAWYVPIGIHRFSSGGRGHKFSYGCKFSNAFDYFTPPDDVGVTFNNPPFCIL